MLAKQEKLFPIYSVYDRFKSEAHTLFINFDLKKHTLEHIKFESNPSIDQAYIVVILLSGNLEISMQRIAQESGR